MEYRGTEISVDQKIDPIFDVNVFDATARIRRPNPQFSDMVEKGLAQWGDETTEHTLSCEDTTRSGAIDGLKEMIDRFLGSPDSSS